MIKAIKENTPAYGADVDGNIDFNIERLEKLIVIRAALMQIHAPSDTETSEPDENSDAQTDPIHPEDMSEQDEVHGPV